MVTITDPSQPARAPIRTIARDAARLLPLRYSLLVCPVWQHLGGQFVPVIIGAAGWPRIPPRFQRGRWTRTKLTLPTSGPTRSSPAPTRLGQYEQVLRTVDPASDEDVFEAVKKTGERGQLCLYIEESLMRASPAVRWSTPGRWLDQSRTAGRSRLVAFYGVRSSLRAGPATVPHGLAAGARWAHRQDR